MFVCLSVGGVGVSGDLGTTYFLNAEKINYVRKLCVDLEICISLFKILDTVTFYN